MCLVKNNTESSSHHVTDCNTLSLQIHAVVAADVALRGHLPANISVTTEAFIVICHVLRALVTIKLDQRALQFALQ